ncbi:MAG: Spy/CpxP family protein refolding chaperone [Deltaproteobacteria bacterium]|nr:Spy/CpxP family protein refolding chaperone [Deltaproteobacteria bacterium]
MKKVTMTIMGLFLAATVATTAYAAHGRGPGYGPCAGGAFQGAAGLNLTTEQMSQINKMREKQYNEIKPLRDQMTAKRDALRKLWLEPNPDKAKITAAQKEMNAVRDQMQEQMTSYRLEADKILTPEQKEKIKFYAGNRGFGPAKGKAKGAGMGGPGGACFGR